MDSAQNVHNSQTQNELQVANGAINRAFVAINAAEKAGANITSLLNTLNNAVNTLSQVENAYSAGGFFDISMVTEVTSTANHLTSLAQNAEEAALVSNETSFWFTIIASIILSLITVIILFLAWHYFKRRYLCSIN